MPLSSANVIQRSSGTFTGTSGSASLPGSTVSGNIVVLVLGQSAALVTPTGFTVLNNNSIVTPKMGIYFKVVGVESSWTIAPSATAVVTWVAYEVAGLDPLNLLDVKPTAISTGTASTLSTGAIVTSSTYDALVIAVHIARDTTSTTPATWSGHTGGLVEIMEQGGSDATTSLGMSVSEVYSLSLGQFLCTATKTAPVGQASTASLVVLAANNSKRAAQIAACTGFEYGTVGGIATGSQPNFNAVTGTPAIVSTSPRNGTYCLELSSSAAIENLLWTNTPSGVLNGGTTQLCARFSVYFPTSLPAGDVVLFSAEPATAGQFTIIRFKNATSKLSIQVGTGTEVVSNATVSTNTWISVDFRIDGRATTHLADWSVRYSDATDWVTQTQASMSSATVPSQGFAARIGWVANTTATVRYDDVVVTNIGGHYPLGDYAVTLLTVDPAGTLTLSGTSTNFQTFTANGTLVAWDATTAKGLIDEVPPVVGASADGFAQVATATADYVEIPMQTLDAAAAGGAIRGVRGYFNGWAASALAAALTLKFHDGVSELNVATNTTGYDNTATSGWHAAMVKGTARQDWTQAKLDALTMRVGYSNDASPAVGIHAAYCEVALKLCDLVRVGDAEEGTFTVDFRIDTDSSAVIAIIVTSAPGDRGCTFEWSILEVPQTPIYVAGGDTHTEYIGATDIATVTGYTLTPDP